MIDTSRSRLARTLLRTFFGALLVLSFLIFILWRTDNPRLQTFRNGLVDAVAPTLEFVAGWSPMVTDVFDGIDSYAALQSENARLRAQVQRLMAWREVAQQLEEENARLRALNQVKLPPRMAFVAAEVIADAGGPYAQSVIVNLGRDDGVVDGAPALDGAGLVGRVFGVGERSARVLLLTDPNSRPPVVIGDSRRRAILQGDGADMPRLRSIEANAEIRPGERVLTSGQGGIFPAGLLVGRVVSVEDQDPAVRLAADLRRLEFVRVLRRDRDLVNTPEGALITRQGVGWMGGDLISQPPASTLSPAPASPPSPPRNPSLAPAPAATSDAN